MEKTDLAAFLSEIVSENTKHYAEDLQYDIRRLFHAAKKPNMEDKSFYWMSRPNGTWCVKERNVFLQGSSEHSIWMYYGYESEQIRAYRIVVTRHSARRHSGRGKVYPLDYAGQLAGYDGPLCRSKQWICILRTVTPRLFRFRMVAESISRPGAGAYPVSAEKRSELTAAILLEHRCQTGKGKKPLTKLSKAHTR